MTAAVPSPEDRPAPRWSRLVRFALALGALAGLVVLGRAAGGQLPRFAAWVAAHGVWGSVVFVLGYALATVALVPASLLTLAAGAIFGLTWGTVYVFIAAVLGASAAFL